jgi:hypothetical protein
MRAEGTLLWAAQQILSPESPMAAICWTRALTKKLSGGLYIFSPVSNIPNITGGKVDVLGFSWPLFIL